VLTFKALAGIVTWLLTAGMLYYLYRQWIGNYKRPKPGPEKGEKLIKSTKNADQKEKTTEAVGSWTSIFKHRISRSAGSNGMDAEGRDKPTTTSTLGSIFSGFKHRSTRTSDVDREGKGKEAADPTSAQRTNDSMA
jgi:hypothetical protein